MTDAQERRSQGSSRVSLETLVEICGNEPGIPAFEAEALDVSARGMHLRTAYLPYEGAPLVCRFEDRGAEIVVEGVVAWRKESAKGGDFGVKFTALDSRSVDVLRGLIERDLATNADKESSRARGSRVRLHIEGLGSPMKARVRAGTSQEVEVGSTLEFLKVGRKLEVEDLEAGGRREARIGGVEVVVDPDTSVPQLVVSLRFEGAEETTPEPSVTDLEADPARAATLFIDPSSVTTGDARPATASRDSTAKAVSERAASSGSESVTSAEEPTPSGDAPAATDDDDDVNGAVPATSRAARRLGVAAENAGEKARVASIAAARFSADAVTRIGKLLGSTGARLAALRAARGAEPKRRTTAPPPGGPVSVEGKRLRPQSAKPGETKHEPAPRRLTKRHAMVGAAGVAVLGAGLAFAMRPANPKEELASAPPAAKVEGAPALASGAPAAASPASPAAAPGGPVVANVPLFGPTPMATLEPAPLGPPPTAEAQAVEAAEIAAAMAAAPPEAEDEEFSDGPAGVTPRKEAAKSEKSKSARPEDVPAFGRGRLHLPVIHRIRLDAPGAALHGTRDALGFTVLIPDRKLMEQGAPIAKRDSRIARIRTTNTPKGAQVRLAFKQSVPAYKVRLRRDYIELWISADEKKSSSDPKKSKR